MVLMDSTSPISLRLLVGDDDVDVLESLARGLRLSGFDVATARDGVEALRSASDNRPDAIVVDINMPVLAGVDVIDSLRAMDRDVPVCVLSAPCSVDGRIAGLEAGADDYLLKAVRAGPVGGTGPGAPTAAAAAHGGLAIVGDHHRRPAGSGHRGPQCPPERH